MIKIDIKKNLFTSDGEIELKADFKIKRGEFIAVSGRSGSGKSTLLRVIAGLESSFGKIEVFGKIWQDGKFFLSPQKRGIGFVFQDYALFSNMTVLQNLLYVKDDKNLAKHLLEITELYPLKDRYPHTLSGGQKQRVALARALMNRPKLLLLDEPLSAVDEELRESLQKEILSLHKEFGTTTILVSHSKKEIESLCDRVWVIRDGVVVKA
jgi:molybdate transport system ATP-binding protein